MDTSLFGGFQFLLRTGCDPLPGPFPVAETDGTDKAGGIAVAAGLAAGRIGAEQAAGGFFFQVQVVHMRSVSLCKDTIFWKIPIFVHENDTEVWPSGRWRQS